MARQDTARQGKVILELTMNNNLWSFKAMTHKAKAEATTHKAKATNYNVSLLNNNSNFEILRDHVYLG